MIGINENYLPGLQTDQSGKEGHHKVILFLACRKLLNRDKTTLSDPKVKIYGKLDGNNEVFIGETETIYDNLNPNFTKAFVMDYIFEIKQELRFEVYDYDSKHKSDDLGSVTTSLSEIMGTQGQTSILNLSLKGQKAGKIIIRGENFEKGKNMVELEFTGRNLIFKGMPLYFQLSRAHAESFEQVEVYRSEPIKRQDTPIWKEIKMPLATLVNNDLNRILTFTLYTNNQFDQQFLAEAQFTLEDIKQGKIKELPLYNQRRVKVGTIQISDFKIEQQFGFLEYLKSGVELNVMVAIDFTQSNGNYKDPKSLHYLQEDDVNDYQKAILEVCDILLNYDSDKMIPLYGFGGKPHSCSKVNHCFALNEDEEDPEVHGLDGILEQYDKALEYVKLSGPTFFHPIIRKAMDLAEQAKSQGSSMYMILLIITDGEIHDMAKTVDLICASSELPLSIVITGVGNEDFTNMNILDADDPSRRLIDSMGQAAQRDLVQFVEFNKFKKQKGELAKEVLAEIPQQFIQYMKSQNIEPGRPVSIDVNKALMSLNTLDNKHPSDETTPLTQKLDSQKTFEKKTTLDYSRLNKMDTIAQQRRQSKQGTQQQTGFDSISRTDSVQVSKPGFSPDSPSKPRHDVPTWDNQHYSTQNPYMMNQFSVQFAPQLNFAGSDTQRQLQHTTTQPSGREEDSCDTDESVRNNIHTRQIQKKSFSVMLNSVPDGMLQKK